MQNFLEKVRATELNNLKKYFKPGMKVLEIGGGNGYQASIIDSWGCEVISIDIEGDNNWEKIYYPIEKYDGKTIPCPDRSFDLVFSSNALEHIQDLSLTLSEICRVLKPNGFSIHLLPTSSWRLWVSLGHYAYIIKRIIYGQSSVPGYIRLPTVQEKLNSNGLFYVISRVLISGPHGEYPNAISELYYFSQFRWSNVFRKNNFHIIKIDKNNLFYTGYILLSSLSLENRQKISSILGSSCNIFIIKPNCFTK